MKWLKSALIAVVLLALLLIGLLLGVDNNTPIALRFLNKESPELPVLWWLFGTFLAGALVGLLIGALGRLRGKLSERHRERS